MDGDQDGLGYELVFGLPPGRNLATPPLGPNSGSDLGAHEGFHKPGNSDGWRHDRFPLFAPAAFGNKMLDADRDGEGMCFDLDGGSRTDCIIPK